jgi:hypothetical protein
MRNVLQHTKIFASIFDFNRHLVNSQMINMGKASPMILTGTTVNHSSGSIAPCVYMDRILR